jgi:3-oxoacyl-[acyl-carrier-protein] synthase-3
MAVSQTPGARIRGIVSSVPSRRFDNRTDTTAFAADDVEKVVRMAGVKSRHVAGDHLCSSDLCLAAGRDLLRQIEWAPATIDAVICVTQTPDYLLPSTSCLLHRWLELPDTCAAFDVGLGCSGYPYGLWLAAMMVQNPGIRRVLLFHGETPTRFSDEADRAVALLFGDAGSATAIESVPDHPSRPWWFSLHTDGTGWRDLIIEGGGFRSRFPTRRRDHFVTMEGANVFNFTIKRIPPLIQETLAASGLPQDQIDYFIFHQSNRFIMKHLARKAAITDERMPSTIETFGSAGGPSVPLTITRGGLVRPTDRPLTLMLLGYGVGLSWGSALIDLGPDAFLGHVEVPEPKPAEPACATAPLP